MDLRSAWKVDAAEVNLIIMSHGGFEDLQRSQIAAVETMSPRKDRGVGVGYNHVKHRCDVSCFELAYNRASVPLSKALITFKSQCESKSKSPSGDGKTIPKRGPLKI